MRKLIIITVLVLAYGGICKAEKPTSYTEVDNIIGRIFFGYEVQEGTTTLYAPIKFKASVRAKTPEGATVHVSTVTSFGALRETPYTAKESYNTLPSQLQGIFRALYQEAIDVDLE